MKAWKPAVALAWYFVFAPYTDEGRSQVGTPMIVKPFATEAACNAYRTAMIGEFYGKAWLCWDERAKEFLMPCPPGWPCPKPEGK